MDDLYELELLALVNKVDLELQNHLDIRDKTLAEFVIALRLESKTFEAFEEKINEETGGSFPRSLVDSIDRFVRVMHPTLKAKTSAGHERHDIHHIEKKAKVFGALALQDLPPDEEESDESDTMNMLEALESKRDIHKSQMHDRDRGRSSDPDKRKRRRLDSGSREREKKSSRYERSDHDTEGKSKRRHNGADGYGDDRHERRNRDTNGTSQRRRDRGDDRGHDQYNKDRESRRPPSDLDDAPVLHKIYSGHITGIKDFGVFVNIHGVKGKVDGLVHVSRLTEGRVNHPSDLFEREQPVKAKVISIEGTRIGLSIKDVDQETGFDLAFQENFGSGANTAILGEKGNGQNHGGPQDARPVPRKRERMTSPERWEIRQLIASGIARASDYPELEADYNATAGGDDGGELEENFDIEVREEEPPFLAGQTKQSLELSPIRIIKAPEGSLNRAAMSGNALAKERMELRQHEADTAAEEKANVNLSAQWNDPLADPNKPKFASELSGANANGSKSENIPEWKRAIHPKNQSYGKRENMTIKQQRESLPVYALRDQLIEAVRKHRILVVIGETGSGKTTQMTQYLAEAGFTNNGIIGCTQPRRVAAMSVAKRVAEEVGCTLGEEVGYSIRFEDKTSPATKIKYMTDGMLQREILQDPQLQKYSVIMLDEAHERTISTDILFALLKKTLKKRPDLKVIVTSATLEAEKFSLYFEHAPIFTIPGRTFPVEIMYSREPETDYLDAALLTVMQIHLTEPAGDILLFLTGQEEIDTSCEILFERTKALGPSVPELIILPVYSALPTEMQSRIFDPTPVGSRKVIIATNIAETSITISSIYYVVDPGFVKQNAYDPKLGMDSLIITPISQAQANQRAGRAGRTGPGKCFRLYTEEAYRSEMLPTSIPEIQRQNLSMTILMLKAMGINDLLHFDFMDPPPTNTMLTALEELYALGALDDEGFLTRLGRKMTNFPIEPSLAKVLLSAVELRCSDELISIVAMLNLMNLFYRPKEKQTQADQKKAKFHDPHGDHLTLLNVYNSWKQSGYSNTWCFENFIQVRSMKRAKDVREQIVKIMERSRQPVVSCGRETEQVRRALCAGFFRNTARRDTAAGAGSYKTLVEGTTVYLHPSSALFGKSTEWVIYHELVLTTREYMRWTTSIEPKWLVEGPQPFFKVGGRDGTMSKRQKQERIQPLYNKFAGEDDWRLSAQRRGGRGGGGGTWG